MERIFASGESGGSARYNPLPRAKVDVALPAMGIVERAGRRIGAENARPVPRDWTVRKGGRMRTDTITRWNAAATRSAEMAGVETPPSDRKPVQGGNKAA